jgi:hypothetical protein
MARVIAQGDMRRSRAAPPPGRNKEIMEDRTRLYSRAAATIDTSGKTLKHSLTN